MTPRWAATRDGDVYSLPPKHPTASVVPPDSAYKYRRHAHKERERGGERRGRHCPSIVDQGMYLDNKRGSTMNEESFLPFRGGNGGGLNPMPYLPARGRNGGPVYLLIIGKLRE